MLSALPVGIKLFSMTYGDCIAARSFVVFVGSQCLVRVFNVDFGCFDDEICRASYTDYQSLKLKDVQNTYFHQLCGSCRCTLCFVNTLASIL